MHTPVYFRGAYDYGYIYVLRHPNARKVGYSCWPETRRREVSKDFGPCELEYEARCWVINLRRAEKHAHALLWDKRLGNEWFDVDANTARRAVISGITAARYDEEVWLPMRISGVELVMTRGPDNHWRSLVSRDPP